jgi:SCY1-like protein 2
MEISPSELELKYGLLELFNAISFLHNDVKVVHLGISPENIYIGLDGKWKLGGLTYSV